MKNVLAIVVTYNRLDLLKECLARLRNLNECDVLVVDNASTDGTKEYLYDFENKKQVIYINTGENIGGAGGFNVGLKKGTELGYKYLWIMDDDTYVQPDTLDNLLAAASELNDNFGWLSSIALWKDNTLCNMNIQKTGIREKITYSDQKMIPAIMATFVSFFVKSETVKKYGLPIKEFFIWSDDLEYSRRISIHEPTYVIGTSKVIHFMNSNNKVGIEQDSIERLWRYKYLYRNEVYVYRREGIKGFLYLWTRLFLHTGKVLFKPGENKKEKLQTIWKSFASGFRFNPPIEYISERS